MAEPLKNMMNEAVIDDMATNFARHWNEFDRARFVRDACNTLETLELKQRTEHITDMMVRYLPDNFAHAGQIMRDSLGPELGSGPSGGGTDANGISGWPINSLTHYVAIHGQDHFELSMLLLKDMTKRATSEFGIRFFLLPDPVKTLAEMKRWTSDPNEHVRRLASEGCRPRLPWAPALPVYIKNPAPVIDLLERLKDDPSEYVRRSVANNLNDISKDHPDLVADLTARWLVGADTNRTKLVRHACRSLIKDGHQKTLRSLGYHAPKLSDVSLSVMTETVTFGEALEFELSITSASKTPQNLLIDYIIHHQKANGTTSPKVFKWKVQTLKATQVLSAEKRHPMRPISTRVYHAGLHMVEVMVNGVSIGKVEFQLLK